MDQQYHIVIIDGMNFMHRARAGFKAGDYPVIYNFFRSLRSLLDQLKPSRALFVLEGKPVAKLAQLASYKANRKISPDDPNKESKEAELESFYRQKDIIVKMLVESFPISVMRHPQHECDDVIHNIILSSSRAVQYTVVSSDTDMIQLVSQFDNVKLYNPITKEYISAPDYDYVTWKSLRGDSADNIPGLDGIGDTKADELVRNPDSLQDFLKSDSTIARQFAGNYQLIKFRDFTRDELIQITSSLPRRQWSLVRDAFDAMQFKSITSDKYWTKFIETFDPLFAA